MVSVGKLKAGHARYYLDQAQSQPSAADALASGAEDYYTGGTEAAGEWRGRGAAGLGLAGTVTAHELHRVLAGQHPLTGAQLRRGGSVAAFDVTFSAPKSVGILFGIGEPDMQSAIREAHQRAVVDAFGYLEDAVSVARRGAGGKHRIRGNGLVAAAFLHRTSRAGDPQLHTHVVVANLVQGSDGRWSALDGRLVYAHARAAGFLYQAALREELSRRLGVGWRPVENGMAEIDGVPSKALRGFSRRRAEIEEAMARRGPRGVTQRRSLHSTRGAGNGTSRRSGSCPSGVSGPRQMGFTSGASAASADRSRPPSDRTGTPSSRRSRDPKGSRASALPSVAATSCRRSARPRARA